MDHDTKPILHTGQKTIKDIYGSYEKTVSLVCDEAARLNRLKTISFGKATDVPRILRNPMTHISMEEIDECH